MRDRERSDDSTQGSSSKCPLSNGLLKQKFMEEKISLLTKLCSNKVEELSIFNVLYINLHINNQIIKYYFILFMT